MSTSGYHPLHDYVLDGIDFIRIDEIFILKHSAVHIDTESRHFFDLLPEAIAINAATFTHAPDNPSFPTVTAIRQLNSLVLSCTCDAPKAGMCSHQARVLHNIVRRAELRIFFDEQLRRNRLLKVAADYGLEKEPSLDNYFDLGYSNRTVTIVPKIRELFAGTASNTRDLKAALLPAGPKDLMTENSKQQTATTILIFSEHKYYKQYKIELYEAELTAGAKIRQVIQPVDPMAFIWKTEDQEAVRFYAAVSRFQHSYESGEQQTDIDALKALLKNPLRLPVFFHNHEIAANLNSSSLLPVSLEVMGLDIQLYVAEQNEFYELSGQMMIGDDHFRLDAIQLRHNYFILHNQVLHLVDNIAFLKVIRFFRKNNNRIVIHQSKFHAFRQEVLNDLEHKISTNYTYLKRATSKQLEEQQMEQDAPELLLYLSDAANHVLITPVVKYGLAEAPVLSRQKIYATDKNGTEFIVERNNELELKFLSLVLLQHPDFNDQLYSDCFYLPKREFLDEGWFLEAFEAWRQNGITLLGFNELKDNDRNPHKAKVSVSVNSGLDWFETSIRLVYGQQRASLKHLHKAIRNKSRYVQLDDGTMGLLPAEWLQRFASYFQAGDIAEEQIRIHKTGFSEVSRLYEEEVLSGEVKAELQHYHKQLSDFSSIEEVTVPETLLATLRDYQHHGLNWLNFLDNFNFGGCLADDMGLGKTIQVIAFILSQRAKRRHNTNLIIVPTTLIFNWQAELQKFAPSIRVHTIYGSDRIRNAHLFDDYEVVLTSYGTLLHDVRFLKQYYFNYIILDESQHIKNPGSQRYKAVRLLQARNRLVLTGTPVENNTFDLYGQLSFACPGLLGSMQHFKEQYATPIDKFKSTKRAIALQKKVGPFILRRTKKQVAKELPDKTEMVIYCEMGEEQRKVYDYYKKEYRDFLLAKQEDELMKYQMHVLKGLTVLRQICDAPALLKDSHMKGTASAKLDVLLEEITARSGRHKILVFSQFVSMLDLVRRQLQEQNIPYQYLTGQTKDREEQVTAFREKDDVRVFLISLKAGGTGLNLTEADYVYIVDPWWNPAVENQAIDRCYRIGQQKQVVAVRLICPGTIEEKIIRLQETKKELANELIRTDGAILKSLSKNDLLDLFS